MMGTKIREKRKELGFSLQTLAQKTDLTVGFLSQIERDIAEPSITSLRKIAKALNVVVFYFLMGTDEVKPVVKKNERQELVFPNSHITYQLLTPDLNRQMEMFIGELEPGAKTCDEPLSHPGEEVILVLEGTMWIVVGEEEYTLEEGDTIYYFATVPHQIINTGITKLRFLSTITPPLF